MSDKYGTGQDGQYCYPDTDVLINKLGITEQDALEAAEIELTQARINQYEPDFDNISLSATRGSRTSAESSRRRTSFFGSLRKKTTSPV